MTTAGREAARSAGFGEDGAGLGAGGVSADAFEGDTISGVVLNVGSVAAGSEAGWVEGTSEPGLDPRTFCWRAA